MTLTPTLTATRNAPGPSSDTAEAMRQYLELMRKPGGVPDEIRGKLQAAQADIDREAEAVQRSAQALSVARDIVESARGELARLETDDRAAIEQHRHVLERWILDGNNSGAPPTAGQSNDIVLAKRRAEVSFEAAKQALASLERRHSDNCNKQLAAEQRLASMEHDAERVNANELVDEVEGLLRRLHEIIPILVCGGIRGVSTPRADAILNMELLLPLVHQLTKASATGGELVPGMGGGVVWSVNASVAGDTRGWQIGNAHWDKLGAALKAAARPSPQESTGEISQERAA